MASPRITASAPALVWRRRFLGVLLLGIGLAFADQAGNLPVLTPPAAIGVLLLFSAADLAFSRRLFEARPSRWPVIGITAAITAWVDPFWGLLAGALAELVCNRTLSPRHRRARSRPTP